MSFRHTHITEFLYGDQVTGMIRDSDIKFQCRLLLMCVAALPVNLQDVFLEPIQEIIRLENERLDKLYEESN